MKTVVYTLTQKIETELEAQLRWVSVLDTAVVNVWLRKYTDAGAYINETLGTALGLASFSFDIEEGNYQMWKSAYPDNTGANRIDLYHGGATKYKYEVDESLPYLKKITDGTGTYWQASNLEVRSSINTNYTDDSSLISKEYADISYLSYSLALLNFYTETEINAMLLNYIDKRIGAAVQNSYSQIYFREPNVPYSMADPVNVKHITNRGWVEAHVTARLASVATGAYQQSGNIIRVIPSGTQESNKVYRTLGTAISTAAGMASATRQMIVEIHGEGVNNATDSNFDLLFPGTASPYIDVIGKTPGAYVRVSEDTYTGTPETDVMANLTFDNNNEDANTTWINRTFYNCRFTNLYNASSGVHNFTNCVFYNCSATGIYNTYTTCKGDITDSAGAQQLRHLGKVGATVASTTDITLTNGNYFYITGTTGISRINATGWTAGSQVLLYFADGLVVTNNVAASGSNKGIIFKSNTNKTYNAANYVGLFLGHNSSVWRELIAY